MAKRKKARWIWIAREAHEEDCWLRARREFSLRGKADQATLRVTAFGSYTLLVNGKRIGSGPVPSGYDRPLLDVYTEDELPLVRGRNVIGLACHNPHVGTPRIERMPGGVWVELMVTYKNGSTFGLVSDDQWRLQRAPDMPGTAPRIAWSGGFAEVRDTRLGPRDWSRTDFDDRDWLVADEVTPRQEGTEETPPWPTDAPVPRPVEDLVRPLAVRSVGRVRPRDGSTAIPFDLTVRDHEIAELFASTFVYSASARTVRLSFDCDEPAAVYVNNRSVIRQEYDERFVRWLTEPEQDTYRGGHRGQAPRAEPVEIDLHQGWNSVGVVVYDPWLAWGFAMQFEDAESGRPLKVRFSPDQKKDDITDWSIITEDICPCGYGGLPETPTPNARTFPDPAQQLAWEIVESDRAAAKAAESVLAEPEGDGPAVLDDAAYVRYDFGEDMTGTVELEVRGPAGSILDAAWGGELDERGNLEVVRGQLRRVDRLVLAGRWQKIRWFERRTLRFLQLVARTEDGEIEVRRVGLRRTTAPAKEPAGVETGDHPVDAAFGLCRATARAAIGTTYEGAPARDAEQSMPAAWLLSKVDRTLWGRGDRSEAALKAFAARQEDHGFIPGIVPSGMQWTVPDWHCLWVLMFADHVAWSGNLLLADELMPVAERALAWTAAYRSTEGLLENVPDVHPWWLLPGMEPMATTAEVTAWQGLYARALRVAADLAEALGDGETADGYREEAGEIAELARERLFRKNRGLFADGRHFQAIAESCSPQANYAALFGGLDDEATARKMMTELWDGQEEAVAWPAGSTPYARTFALVTLLERGEVARALSLVRGTWGDMAAAGRGTAAERWPENEEPSGEAYGPYRVRPKPVACHGWGAAAEAIVAAHLVGVRPEGPGFDPARVAPMPGPLTSYTGSVWTPRGRAEIEVASPGGRRRITVSLPKGMAYRLDRSHLAEDDEIEVIGGDEV